MRPSYARQYPRLVDHANRAGRIFLNIPITRMVRIASSDAALTVRTIPNKPQNDGIDGSREVKRCIANKALLGEIADHPLTFPS
jgi:hypothetical protein